MIIPRLRAAPLHRRSFTLCAAARVVLLGLLLSTVSAVRVWSAAGGSESAPKQAAKPYALIFGTVWGPDDHPLYGVRIRIRREGEKKVRWELYSDHSGEFAQRVPAGKQDYVIWADVKDRKSENGNPLLGEEVRVHVDADERVDTGLHLK